MFATTQSHAKQKQASGRTPSTPASRRNPPHAQAFRFDYTFRSIPIHPSSRTIQTKLVINQPGDQYEQEADHAADEVMRASTPRVQRACECGGTCSGCRGGSAETAPPIVEEALRSPGQRLDPETASFMESGFGRDFSHVRLHTGDLAAKSAEAVSARAYTVDSDIMFAAGQFAPSTEEGRRLLAHELTHVLQQAPHRLARDKSVLEKEGKTGETILDDVNTVKRIVLATLADPNEPLFPYIQKMLKDPRIAQTKYHILSVGGFAKEYRDYSKRRNKPVDPSIPDEKLVAEIGGFYEQYANAIFLKERSNYCDALHETIHDLSSPDRVGQILGWKMMEGLTQYFTDRVVEQQTQSVCKRHSYTKELECATALVNVVGFDKAIRFFLGNATGDEIAAPLGLKTEDDLKQLGTDGICAKAKAVSAKTKTQSPPTKPRGIVVPPVIIN